MTVENKQVALVKWKTWLKSLGVHSSTGYRWRKEGRIVPTVNIDGHWYLEAETIEDFLKRAKAGEFAGVVGKPRSRKNSPKL